MMDVDRLITAGNADFSFFGESLVHVYRLLLGVQLYTLQTFLYR
jgi:hypothetical protein